MAYVTTPIPAAANTARVLLTTGAIEEFWWVMGQKTKTRCPHVHYTRDVNFRLRHVTKKRKGVPLRPVLNLGVFGYGQTIEHVSVILHDGGPSRPEIQVPLVISGHWTLAA